jgi:hypothetical protein
MILAKGSPPIGLMTPFLCALQIAALCAALPADASHDAGERHPVDVQEEAAESGRAVPGAGFQVVFRRGTGGPGDEHDETAVRTVVDALAFLVQHRKEYPRVDESLAKGALQAVIIEPTVVNDEGTEFAFLVARTPQPGRVKLLISAASLRAQGWLGRPDALVPPLAREFQWVASKADTAPKAGMGGMCVARRSGRMPRSCGSRAKSEPDF